MSQINTIECPDHEQAICLRSKRPQVRILPGAPLSNDLQPNLPEVTVYPEGQIESQTEQKPSKPFRLKFGCPESIKLIQQQSILLKEYLRLVVTPRLIRPRTWWKMRYCTYCQTLIHKGDLTVMTEAGSWSRVIAHERCFTERLVLLRAKLRSLGYEPDRMVTHG